MNFPELTLVLDIGDIKRWGLLAFLLGFSFSILDEKTKKSLQLYSFQRGV